MGGPGWTIKENTMSTRSGLALILAVLCGGRLTAQTSSQDRHVMRPSTTGAEGTRTVTMDHSHEFVTTPKLGRIVMQRESDDAERVARLRAHLAEIARLFTAGDFRLPPGTNRTQEVPGVRVMNERHARITFTARPLPRGSSVVISSADRAAVAAIHAFLEFHRLEHEALERQP
jgi:hypothetical protein